MSTTTTMVRQMQLKHMQQVLAIEAEAFDTPWSERAFVMELDKLGACCLVAMHARRVVGYVVASQVLDEGQILRLAVGKRWQRHGIGDMLARTALTMLQARGCAVVYLELRASNGPARSLYGALGFAPQGVRARYYSSPVEDAVVMRLELTAVRP